MLNRDLDFFWDKQIKLVIFLKVRKLMKRGKFSLYYILTYFLSNRKLEYDLRERFDQLIY